MLIGSVYGWEPGEDDLFNPLSTRNRDNCLEPMRVLEQYARTQNIELHTQDVVRNLGLTPAFNLYVESIPVDQGGPGKNFLILFETSLTVPINGDFHYLNQFDEIFTWNLNLLEAKARGDLNDCLTRPVLTEIRIPNPIPLEFWNDHLQFGFSGRPQFCCLIGSNRHANALDERELYSERVRAIRWFEGHTSNQFFLYGNGWRVPQKRLGKYGKFKYRLEKIIPFLTRKPIFSSYQGPASSKQEVLSKTRYCICFENARDISGYLTEKIFDCLFAGCVPIYWGEPNIEQWLPPGCFIDFRKFNSSYEALYQYLTDIPEKAYIEMQKSGREFIKSNSFEPHSSDSFARKIIDRIYNRFS